MLSEWLRSAAALLKSAMDKWGGNSSEGTTSVAKNAAVRIDEIEPGNGPTWGTLSGLTAHPSDPSRLYAVTDKDSPPVRILEIDASASSARVVRQIPVIAPGFESLDLEAIVVQPDGGFWGSLDELSGCHQGCRAVGVRLDPDGRA